MYSSGHTRRAYISILVLTKVISHHKDIFGEWRYMASAFLTSAADEVSGQLHAPTDLLPGTEPLVPIG